jgi:GNAT superfamily N-acetyltransferase
VARTKPPPSAVVEDYDRARHGDGPARVVEAVYREYGFTWEPEGYHLDVLRPEEAYRAPDAFFAVATRDGRVIGTIGGTRHGDEAELKRLYLLREERGQGVGRALAERFLAWARAVGCSRAVLWSDKRFTDAHRLYLRLGFSVTSERICEPDPDKSPEWGCTLLL